MSGIFTYYVIDLKRRMHAHMFSYFLLALLEGVYEQAQVMGTFYILSQFCPILFFVSHALILVSDLKTVTTSFLTPLLLLWFF